MKILVVLTPKDMDELAHAIGFAQTMKMPYEMQFLEEKKEERPLVLGDRDSMLQVGEHKLWPETRKAVPLTGIMRKDLVTAVSKTSRKSRRFVGTSIAYFIRKGALKEG